MSDQDDVKALGARLQELEKAYWLDNNALVPDQVYDDLRRRYRELTKGKERPIGHGGRGFVALPSPMYSLDNVFNRDEFEKWVRAVRKRAETDEIEFIVEPKYDGISLSLHFKGELLEAYTRGNGKEGEPIKDKLPLYLRTLYLSSPVEVEVRGEVFVTKEVFEEINTSRNPKYKTPRQCAVGILRGSNETYKNKLSFRCFGLGVGYDLFVSETDILFNDLLNVVECAQLDYRGYNASDAYKACEKLCMTAKDNDTPIDGAVIKVNDISLRDKLGFTAHHPRWATAVKLKEEDHSTTINGVEWNVGIQGTITPTILVDPVNVDGVTISRVTGDNATRFNHAHYALGDTVWIKRAGDVIPKITRHQKRKGKRTELTSPERCPGCNDKVTFNGMYLRCQHGFLCSGQAKAKLLHFVSRDALDLKGFGLKTIEWALSKGVRTGAQLLIYFRDGANLGPIHNEFGMTTALKLMGEASREKYPLSKILYSLAIPQVGLVSAEKLGQCFKNLIDFYDSFSVNMDPIVDGVSDNVITNIRYWVDHPVLQKELFSLNGLLDVIPVEKPTERPVGLVCFTGYGDVYDRGMLETSAKRVNYRVGKTVTKNTTYLVAGKKGASKGKIDKAMRLKIPVISVPDWIKKTV